VKFSPRDELGPQSELCPLGGLFTPSFTPRGEHPHCLEEWRGEQRVFTPRGQLHPWGPTSPLEANFTPRGQLHPWRPTSSPGCKISPLGAKLKTGLWFLWAKKDWSIFFNLPMNAESSSSTNRKQRLRRSWLMRRLSRESTECADSSRKRANRSFYARNGCDLLYISKQACNHRNLKPRSLIVLFYFFRKITLLE
jgi:hypothetical protein